MVQRDWLVRSHDQWRTIASFWSWYGKAARSLRTYSFTGRQPYFFPFILFPFLFTLLSLPSCLVKINLNSLPSFLGRNHSKTVPNLSLLHILLTEPTYSLSISHQMILLALAETGKIRGHSSINTQSTTIIFIRLLPPTTLLPRGETLFHLPLTNILEKFKEFSSTTRKSSKTFSPAKLSLPQATNNPEIFKDFPTSKSNQQQQPAEATSSSNQQQQQSAAAINSSNQQQQSTAATNSSNQQQQSTAATNSSNQHSAYQQHLHNQRRPPLVTITVPSRGYPASSWPRTSCPVAECNHRTEAHFCYFSTFLKFIFVFFPFFAKT